MAPIRLTYGNQALAWGRDQALSAKALATEGAREAPRALPASERAETSGAVARTPASSPVVAPGVATAGNRFARLLADIASANAVFDEHVATDATTTVPTNASRNPTATTSASLSSKLAVNENAALPPHALVTQAIVAQGTTLADAAIERRNQLEDRARRIALTSPRRGPMASPHLAVSYDQVLLVPLPKHLDRRA